MLRYIVERIADASFPELELPIDVDMSGRSLSTAGRFSGKVSPDIGALRGTDGQLLLEPGATFIHEEADGVIRGSWLVTSSKMDGPDWLIEGAGLSSFLAGRPYEGEYRGVKVDLGEVIAHLWAHAQSFAGADIGVTVRGLTGIRRGTNSDALADAAKAVAEQRKAEKKTATANRQAKTKQIQAVTKSHDAGIKGLQGTSKARLTTLQNLRRAKAEKPQIDAAQAARNAAVAAVKSAQAAKTNALAPLKAQLVSLQTAEKNATAAQQKADEAYRVAKDKASSDGGAWKILWWDTPDCAQQVQEALDTADAEFVEWSSWNASRTKVLKEIRVSPRAGVRRDTPKFVEGDNIVETVVLEDDLSAYANTVVAIGAGEGRKALRVTLSRPDNRRRRVRTLDAKHITKREALEKLARAELDRASRRLKVDAIRVDASHDFAPRGSFELGDTILVDCEVDWLGRKQLWHRITGIEWVDLDICDLELEQA